MKRVVAPEHRAAAGSAAGAEPGGVPDRFQCRQDDAFTTLDLIRDGRSAGDDPLLADRRAYPRYLAMILFHLLDDNEVQRAA